MYLAVILQIFFFFLNCYQQKMSIYREVKFSLCVVNINMYFHIKNKIKIWACMDQGQSLMDTGVHIVSFSKRYFFCGFLL